ncbi:MAG: hypothetical protein K8T25_25115 [Planctomycetia bacterium]|nr:hypothetical protein [Planctomycetia bacterium]
MPCQSIHRRAASRFQNELWIAATAFFLVATTGCSSQAAEGPAGPPATVTQATQVFNLATYPLPDKAETPQRRTVAGMSCNVPGEVKAVHDSQRKALEGMQWKEIPGGSVSDQSATGMFRRDGFTLSLSVFPGGKPGMVNLMLLNLGNVRLSDLPVPPDAKQLFPGPASVMYVADAPAGATADACQKLLVEKGWQPYGVAGDTRFFKQNAMRLTAYIAAAPAQGGKTMITYSAELMSVDLPAPPDAIGVQYSDSTAALSFDSKLPLVDLAKQYRALLAKSGWDATTENPIKIGFKHMLIFRNPQKDLLTLEMHEVDGITRVLLKFQTAAEVEEMDRRIKAEIEKKKKEMGK